ncbi:undecaprenyl-diphosphate phosphatase [Bartonella sp. HY406]|uniref:undecaprenyl-diphosphate phosphatase n=1 Tax=Bartonella sp. HY406 TaxID=2979331 RepID=UPI0021CA43B4|nr:undecaprenyl-diphosphate phosphatase [Bartonella sp. HY406]UXN04009.1 undecaprenyl-diphosphate phosphatase [Bartonella sp. HY406]
MDLYQIFNSFFLGLIEGLTEFIPVSSTGHLILIGHFLGFNSPQKTFEILIQLGAILAILTVYFGKLAFIARNFTSDASVRRFVLGVLLAFLPAVFIGFALHSVIKTYLLASPLLVCISLIIGGVILLAVDKMDLKPRYDDATKYPLGMCLAIGFCQCLAMIPGVSRSGSTIVAALLMGANKRSAAEFSFFLALPTMAGAFALELFKSYRVLTFNDGLYIIIGFVVAFISGVFVVRHLLDYVSRKGFMLFGWWRIIVGVLGLAALKIWS